MRLRREHVSALVDAARDDQPISGLTHNFYRYPARFSPKLARAAIEAFSDPDDLILDPFMGGGTSLVEAMALGRNGFGTDISSLAAFVSEVKTTLYDERDLGELERWAATVAAHLNVHSAAVEFPAYAEAGYHKHMGRSGTWRLQKVIGQALELASELTTDRLERLARCVVLRTAQWALDGRKTIPSVDRFRTMITQDAGRIANGARELRKSVETLRSKKTVVVSCLNRPSRGLEDEPLLRGGKKPALVVTSPPYPGIHVLYHRWQVDGRKETPAPFWIANKLDGSGSSYYTMGDRKAYKLHTYFTNLRESLTSIAAVCDKATTIVQVVAFSEPKWQLPRYLECTSEAGLVEQFLPNANLGKDRRLWRTVPNRKWHANQKGHTAGSQEVVLFHRLK